MNDVSFGKYTSILYRYNQIYINHQLKPYRIGSGQYFFLIAIHKHDGINQKELTKIMNIDKATTAKALKKLEENNMVTRLKDESDKRYYNIHLTEKGKEFMPVLRKILDDVTSIMSKGMSESDLEMTSYLLELMMKNVIEAVSDLKE